MSRMQKYQLINAAKEAGVVLTDEGYKLEVFAPKGKVMGTTVTHFLTYYTKGWTRSQLYEEIKNDLRMGIIDCPDHGHGEGCEVCEEPTVPFDVESESILFIPEGIQS